MAIPGDLRVVANISMESFPLCLGRCAWQWQEETDQWCTEACGGCFIQLMQWKHLGPQAVKEVIKKMAKISEKKATKKSERVAFRNTLLSLRRLLALLPLLLLLLLLGLLSLFAIVVAATIVG